jgi:hypothetical protein
VRAELSAAPSWPLPPHLSLHDTTSDLPSGVARLVFRIAARPPAAPADVSLLLAADLSLSSAGAGYPFSPPLLSLLDGSEHLPGAQPRNGEAIGTTLQWTPSLAALDAVRDVAVRLRESVRSGEPFDMSAPPPPAPSPPPRKASLLGAGARRPSAPPPAKIAASPASALSLDDQLSLPLSSIPLFPATLLHRPSFLPPRRSSRTALAAGSVGEVAGEAGGFFKRAFSSVSSSASAAAGGLLSDTYIGLTNGQILEVTCSKFAPDVGTVTLVAEVKELAKLKFRRGESVSFT